MVPPLLRRIAVVVAFASSVCHAQTTAPVDLSFRDLYRLPVGSRGLEPSELLKSAVGGRVHLRGYVVEGHGVKERGEETFLLSPVPVHLPDESDGPADDLPPTVVLVNAVGRRSPPGGALVQLTGRLEFGRAVDGEGRVSWLRLDLDEDAAQ